MNVQTVIETKRGCAKAEHDIELDGAGWMGRSRLTCHSCGETCLKQPHMSSLEWLEKVSKFTIAHPSRVGEQYNKSLARPA